jgi:hypothetical protein
MAVEGGSLSGWLADGGAAILLARFRSGKARAIMLHTLVRVRLQDLSVPARVSLVRSLSSEHKRHRAVSSRAISDVLEGTRGEALMSLKTSLSRESVQHDLFRLVYRDLSGSPAQVAALQHLALQAEVLAREPQPMQVVSDFDDTLEQGWKDRRVPRGVVYPGGQAFVRALLAQRQRVRSSGGPAPPLAMDDVDIGASVTMDARGEIESSQVVESEAEEVLSLAGGWLRTHRAPATPRSSPASHAFDSSLLESVLESLCGKVGALATERLPPEAGHLAILTARPAGAFDLLRKRTLERCQSLGFHNVTMLAGTVESGVFAGRIAEKKASNLSLYLALWRESPAVFIGDSGQGDAAVAAEALTRHAGQVVAAFIHDVTPEDALTGDGSDKDALRDAGVKLFRNYAHAALQAREGGLLPAGDAAVVVVECLEQARKLLRQAPKTSRHYVEQIVQDSQEFLSSKQ